jgi:hypothetical protein
MIEKNFSITQLNFTSTESFSKTFSYIKKYMNGEHSYVDLILQCFDHNFKSWARYLEDDNYYEDFTIYSICRFLDKDNKPVGCVEEKLKIYRFVVKDNSDTIYNDIVLLFLEFLNKKTMLTKGSYKSEKNVYYHIAMEMKYAIFVHIRKTVQMYKRDLHYHLGEFEFNRNPSYQENFELKIFLDAIDDFSPWHRYLFLLIKEGFTVDERCKLLYLTPKQLSKEENLIWQYLRQRQSDNLKDQDQT